MVVPVSLTSSRKWANPDEMELDEVSFKVFFFFFEEKEIMHNLCLFRKEVCT